MQFFVRISNMAPVELSNSLTVSRGGKVPRLYMQIQDEEEFLDRAYFGSLTITLEMEFMISSDPRS
jgi:hypothetical protein